MNFRAAFCVVVISTFFFGVSWDCRADEWDPLDDAVEGATDLGSPGVDEGMHGPHTLSSSDEADWFRFSLEEENTYEFYSAGFSDTVGDLYASDGTTVVASNDESEGDINFQIRYTPLESGIFYLKVRLFEVGYEGAYDLHYANRSAAPSPDQWDPADDTHLGATDLGSPSTETQSHGLHTLSEEDTYDWFLFTLKAGEVYEFYTMGSYDTIGDLYLANATTRIASSDSDDGDRNFRIHISVPETGIYYLRVHLVDKDLSGKYTLTYRSGAEPLPPGDNWDPYDDIYDGAVRLESPTAEIATHGPHSLSETDRFDWFLFVLDKGATYEFATTGESDTVGDLYAPDGTTELATDNDGAEGNNFKIVFTAGEQGKYFLRVREYSTGSAEYTLTYRLVSEPSPVVLDEWDSQDDTFEGANEIDLTGDEIIAHGPHTLSRDDLYDWFAFDVEAGVDYQLWTTGDSDTVGTLYASDGTTQLLEKDDGASGYNFDIHYTATINTIVYLRVRLYDLGGKGTYELKAMRVVVPPSGGDAWDPMDDVPDGATELSPPTYAGSIHGPHRLSTSDLFDWFQMNLTEGIAYEFYTQGDSDTVGALYFSDQNNEIQEKDEGGSGSNFSLRIVPEESGIYYLRVSEFQGGDAIYTLHYRGEQSPSELLNPLRAFPFDDETVYEVFPGGFIEAAEGTAAQGTIPAQEGYSDGEGLMLTTAPEEVVLVLFPELDVGDSTVFVRAAFRSTGSGAEATLGALDSSMDGSIATNAISDTATIQNGYEYRGVLFQVPKGGVFPVVQLSNLSGREEVSVYLDNLEIYLIPDEGTVPGWLFSGSGEGVETSVFEASPLRRFALDSSDEFTEYEGGFIDADGAAVAVGNTVVAEEYSDGQGAVMIAEEEQVSLLLFSEVVSDGDAVLVRASVRSSGPGAAVALGTMDKGESPNISTNIPADSSVFESEYKRIVLLAQPSSDGFFPLFQIAHQAGQPQTTVFMDNLEVFVLHPEDSIPVEVLKGM